MADYKLYGFNDSGHSYKVALMLELLKQPWEAVAVDFFKGETRGEQYRSEVNEMGEVPVLVDGDLKLTQSAVILNYLSEKYGQFHGTTDAEKREVWRWVMYDNHKVSGVVGQYRFMKYIKKMKEGEAQLYLKGRIWDAFSVMNKHLEGREWFALDRPTIADISLCSYLYFAEEFGLDLNEFPNMKAWLERIQKLDGWQHSYDLLPTAEK